MIIYMKKHVYSNKFATKIQPLIELLDMGLKLWVRWKSWQCLLSGLLRLAAAPFCWVRLPLRPHEVKVQNATAWQVRWLRERLVGLGAWKPWEFHKLFWARKFCRDRAGFIGFCAGYVFALNGFVPSATLSHFILCREAAASKHKTVLVSFEGISILSAQNPPLKFIPSLCLSTSSASTKPIPFFWLIIWKKIQGWTIRIQSVGHGFCA